MPCRGVFSFHVFRDDVGSSGLFAGAKEFGRVLEHILSRACRAAGAECLENMVIQWFFCYCTSWDFCGVFQLAVYGGLISFADQVRMFADATSVLFAGPIFVYCLCMCHCHAFLPVVFSVFNFMFDGV